MKIHLPVIREPKPGTKAILVKPEGAALEPFLIGLGKDDLVCGKCGFLLFTKMSEGQVTGIVAKCPQCGSYNQT